MDKTQISIGDRIELEHRKSKLGPSRLSKNKYGSQLLDYNGLRDAKISMPIFEGKIIPLEVGDEYGLCFYTNSGLYQCNCFIVKRYLQKNMYILDVEFITPLKRFQRRKFYRLDCLFLMKFRLIMDEEKRILGKLRKNEFKDAAERKLLKEKLEKLQNSWEEGNVSDISGGGIRFHNKSVFEADDEMELDLPLPMEIGIVPMRLKMRVIRCNHNEDGKFPYEIRGEFVNTNDNDRERIIKYVFEEQRKRMKR